jgi:hypothetical protein
LAQHRTAAPTAQSVKAWPYKRAWEATVMDCATASGAVRIGLEVFDFDNVDAVLQRLDTLFGTMLPDPRYVVPYGGVLSEDEEADVTDESVSSPV